MERELQVQAVVTGSYNFGELHRGVNLFSPELGQIKAIIFGGRKGKKTSLAPLFSFGTFQLYFNPVKDEYSIIEEDCKFIAQNISTDIEAVYTASYFCELFNKVNTDEPVQAYSLITKALIQLERTPALHKKVLIDFTWQFLRLNGVASDFENCPSCDCHLSDEETLLFSTSMTTPVCSRCADTDKILLPPGARKYLRYTFNMSFEQAFEVKLLEGATQRLNSFMLNWITVFAQTPLKTVRSGIL